MKRCIELCGIGKKFNDMVNGKFVDFCIINRDFYGEIYVNMMIIRGIKNLNEICNLMLPSGNS